MSDPAGAEFGSLAEWTGQVAHDLGPEYHIPAGCRGSGSPAVLDWLITHLELRSGETLLDLGAGVGGPAAYAASQRSVDPILVEPQAGGCSAAKRLFGFPAIQADASALPFPDGSFDAGWALGVLCTTEEQVDLLRELRRVVQPPGRVGLLVLVARELSPPGEPEDSYFPTRNVLEECMDRAELRIDDWRSAADIWAPPDRWRQRVTAVEDELRRRYGDREDWRVADEQSQRIAGLLKDGMIDPQIFSLRRAG